MSQHKLLSADLSDASQDDLDEISHMLNTRPRKALDFQTPREVYMKEFKHSIQIITGVALDTRNYLNIIGGSSASN